jgi:hypothetical protein
VHETLWPLRAEGGGEGVGRRGGGQKEGEEEGEEKKMAEEDTFPDDASDEELRGEACFGVRARPPVG